jgi:hypothetical protein
VAVDAGVGEVTGVAADAGVAVTEFADPGVRPVRVGRDNAPTDAEVAAGAV